MRTGMKPCVLKERKKKRMKPERAGNGIARPSVELRANLVVCADPLHIHAHALARILVRESCVRRADVSKLDSYSFHRSQIQAEPRVKQRTN
mmetsp:Transcript_10652/g.28453  ORF Transcript_10652/g.28453 Transcript_10652/m.28453 type:complete len:92 (+) Transcript_10652:1999-2274(+)